MVNLCFYYYCFFNLIFIFQEDKIQAKVCIFMFLKTVERIRQWKFLCLNLTCLKQLNSASCRYVQVVLKLCKKNIHLSISFSTVEFNLQSCIFSQFIACIYTRQPMLIFFSFDNDQMKLYMCILRAFILNINIFLLKLFVTNKDYDLRQAEKTKACFNLELIFLERDLQ